MPLVAIPFRLPPAFPLPPHWEDYLDADAGTDVSGRAIELLKQLDAADLIWLSKRVGDGWHLWDQWGRASLADDVATRIAEEFTQGGWRTRIWDEATQQGHPMLVMGDGVGGLEPEVPPALAAIIGATAPLGFLYVFPILDAANQVVAQKTLYRQMVNGPLNHDQPAIVQSLLRLIAEASPFPAHS